MTEAREMARTIRESHGYPRHLRPAEVAKLIRPRLKKVFPGTKFSVRTRTYSGGASINVQWTDGPSEDAVREVVGAFQGARFDGMIDLGYSVDHWLLPDGTVQVAIDRGTEDSRGTRPAHATAKPHEDAELVSFGTLYVSPSRTVSPALARKVLAKLAERWGFEAPEVEEGYRGGWRFVDPSASNLRVGGEYLTDLYWREIKGLNEEEA